ncbi:hypothetical protein T484DRAFT_1855729, partial [Baffinella frigidus]
MSQMKLHHGIRSGQPTPEAISTLRSLRAVMKELLGVQLDMLEDACSEDELDILNAKLDWVLRALLALGYQFHLGVTNGRGIVFVDGTPLLRKDEGLHRALARRGRHETQPVYSRRQETSKDGYFFGGEMNEKGEHVVALEPLCLTKCTDKTSPRRIDRLEARLIKSGLFLNPSRGCPGVKGDGYNKGCMTQIDATGVGVLYLAVSAEMHVDVPRYMFYAADLRAVESLLRRRVQEGPGAEAGSAGRSALRKTRKARLPRLLSEEAREAKSIDMTGR